VAGSTDQGQGDRRAWRGYQTRWFNNMGQKYAIESHGSGDVELALANSSKDDLNRLLFEEVFEILQLAWKDEPFLSRVASGNIRIPSKKYGLAGPTGRKNTAHPASWSMAS